jgi:hypothetical protein
LEPTGQESSQHFLQFSPQAFWPAMAPVQIVDELPGQFSFKQFP